MHTDATVELNMKQPDSKRHDAATQLHGRSEFTSCCASGFLIFSDGGTYEKR